jgi:hypothetical protein
MHIFRGRCWGLLPRNHQGVRRRKGDGLEQGILSELRRDFSDLKSRNLKIKKRDNPLALEIISTLEGAAAVIGVSRMSLFRYRRMFEFSSLPAFKNTILNWAKTHHFPKKRGPLPRRNMK